MSHESTIPKRKDRLPVIMFQRRAVRLRGVFCLLVWLISSYVCLLNAGNFPTLLEGMEILNYYM